MPNFFSERDDDGFQPVASTVLISRPAVPAHLVSSLLRLDVFPCEGARPARLTAVVSLLAEAVAVVLPLMEAAEVDKVAGNRMDPNEGARSRLALQTLRVRHGARRRQCKQRAEADGRDERAQRHDGRSSEESTWMRSWSISVGRL